MVGRGFHASPDVSTMRSGSAECNPICLFLGRARLGASDAGIVGRALDRNSKPYKP